MLDRPPETTKPSTTLVRSLVLTWSVAAILLIGGLTTIGWLFFDPIQWSAFQSNITQIALALTITLILTASNLLIRWGRWHFLTRRYGIQLAAKQSLRIWFCTLPALLTPFYLGELVRGTFLRKYSSTPFHFSFALWITERGLDSLAITIIWLTSSGLVALAAILLSLSVAFIALLLRKHTVSFWQLWTNSSALTLTSLLCWLLPGISLWMLVKACNPNLYPQFSTSLNAFCSGTLAGGISGIPLGTGISGSVTILKLVAAGISEPIAILSSALLRAGTAWFSVGLGLLLAFNWRRLLIQPHSERTGSDHFDDLADGYEAQIPDHVRSRLLNRKIDMMVSTLPSNPLNFPLKGLDLGCGHGWYACEMAMHGFEMTGVDLSSGQIDQARQYAAAKQIPLQVQVASATSLPFPDKTFDFVYSINVLHHIEDPEAQARTFTEIVRVLKPEGRFFLHEMNVENPLFNLYMSYLFPVIRDIDEGTEHWIRPRSLPEVPGATWEPEIHYFTFLPDFIPETLLRIFGSLEKRLEASRFAKWSAHYLAILRPLVSPKEEQSSARPTVREASDK